MVRSDVIAGYNAVHMHVIQKFLITVYEKIQYLRQGKVRMKVGSVKKFRTVFSYPDFFLDGLAICIIHALWKRYKRYWKGFSWFTFAVSTILKLLQMFALR